MSMSIHFWTAKLFPIFMSAENTYEKLILHLHHWHWGLAVLKPLSFSRIFTSTYRFYILITISNYLNHKAIDLDIPGMVSLFKSRLSNHYGYGKMLNPITSKSFNPINPIKIKRHWKLIILWNSATNGWLEYFYYHILLSTNLYYNLGALPQFLRFTSKSLCIATKILWIWRKSMLINLYLTIKSYYSSNRKESSVG